MKIYENGIDKSATFEECEGLESFSIWGDGHVIERINDYYAGNTKGITYRGRLKAFDEPTIIQLGRERLKNNKNL